jgi:hypothetical protein
MKKRTIAMVLAAAMMVLAAGCQKEEATRVAPVNSVRTVEYSIDNTRQHVTVKGTAEWQALLGESLDSVAAGHLVNISHGAGANYAKERRMYSTDSRDAALAWVDARFNEGYDVTMWYDEEEGKYICVASKRATSSGRAPNGFVYQPLQQYILGSWTKSMDRIVTLAPGAADVDLDPQYGIMTMTWEQIYDFYKIEPTMSTDSSFLHLEITNDTITIGPHIYRDYVTGELFPPSAYLKYSIAYSIVSEDLIVNGYGYQDLYETKRRLYHWNVWDRFRAYEWSQDTMLVFFENRSNICPTVYVKK